MAFSGGRIRTVSPPVRIVSKAIRFRRSSIRLIPDPLQLVRDLNLIGSRSSRPIVGLFGGEKTATECKEKNQGKVSEFDHQ